MIRQYRFSVKFYLGIFLIILSFIIGKVTTFLFFLHFDDVALRYASLIIYFVSWPLLFLGVWWVGKEYSDAVRRYVSYQFYQESVKKGTQKAVEKTKQFHRAVGARIQKIKGRVKEKRDSKKEKV
ncbi:hypothetical protein HYV86_07735 [Candidatus Woesearchaeota archaeon]|nr:hypothetical protein [Candidatus Woesearchaeota archaeon]